MPVTRSHSYAARFLAEHGREHGLTLTDAALAETFAPCVRPARRDEYDSIRHAITTWREWL